VGAADVHDDLAGEGLAHAGAMTGLVELGGGVGVGVGVEQLVEQRERGGRRLAGLPGVEGVGIVRLWVWPPRRRT
jgi:hypothetical protein